MIHVPRSLMPAAVALLLPLVSCGPATPATPTAPPATSTPSPIPPSPTPTLAATLRGPVVQIDVEGTQALGLLENEAATAVQSLVLHILFLDQQGEVLKEAPSAPSLPWLAPGAASPFQAQYTAGPPPAEARLERLTYQVREAPVSTFETRLSSHYVAPSGGSRVLGELRASGTGTTSVHALAVVAETEGSINGVTNLAVYPHRLSRGKWTPFEATFGTDLSGSTFTAFAAGEPLAGGPFGALEVVLEPGLATDAQGNPFVVGALSNPTSTPVSDRVLLEVRSSGKTVRIIELGTEIPIRPEEIRPFAARLDGLPPRTVESELSIHPLPDSEAQQERRIVVLKAQILSIERIGGSLFLGGQVRNESDQPVASPALYGALRSTEGDLQSAAWISLGDRLLPQAATDFVLSLPLPAAVALADVEFDLRALGTATGATR